MQTSLGMQPQYVRVTCIWKIKKSKNELWQGCQ